MFSVTMENEIITVISMLISFSIFGTIGNSLTLYFFVRKSTTVPHIFIRTLATVDLITCLTTIPITIYMEYIFFRTDNIFLCWAYGFLTTSTISFATMLMVPIAVDRFISLCRPLSQRMTRKSAYVIILVITMCSLLLGILLMLTHNIIHAGNPTGYSTQPTLINSINTSLFRNDTYPDFNFIYFINVDVCAKSNYIPSREFMDGFNIFYASVFGVSITVTLTLYIIIFIYIVITHKRRRQLFEETSSRSKNTVELIEHNDRPHSEVVTCVNMPIFMSDIKLGVKLFAMSLVFIVVYLPAFLMTELLIPANVIIFYLYFSYNVLHPITYVILDKSIKKQYFLQKCC